MNSSTTQTVLALALVALAMAYLAWRAFGRKKNPGCGGDCGCAPAALKDKLKR
jgi:hypothetical protein